MKKLLLLSIATIVIIGISNAQSTQFYCTGDPAPSVCGYYDSDGYWWFTKCIAVNCQGDNNNCGTVGHVCGSGMACAGGVCLPDPNCSLSDPTSGCGTGGPVPLPPRREVRLPTRLKPLQPIKL